MEPARGRIIPFPVVMDTAAVDQSQSVPDYVDRDGPMLTNEQFELLANRLEDEDRQQVMTRFVWRARLKMTAMIAATILVLASLFLLRHAPGAMFQIASAAALFSTGYVVGTRASQ